MILHIVRGIKAKDVLEGRVRILRQKSQKGKPAKDVHESTSDMMNIGHQDWLKGLAETVLATKEK